MKARDFKYAFMISGLLASGINSFAQENDKKPKKEKEQTEQIETPKIKVDYQNKIADENDNANTAAFYSYSDNSITVLNRIGENNTFSNSNSTLAHEYKHKYDYKCWEDYLSGMSLSQRVQTDRNMEIAATICELLQLREEYINADSKEARDAVINSAAGKKFDYYFDKVKSGEINPLDNQHIEQEMVFIGSATAEMWDERFYYSENYQEQFKGQALHYFKTHDYDQLWYNDHNYYSLRQEIFSIGGFDFSSYIPEHDFAYSYGSRADKAIEENKSRQAVEQILSHNYQPTLQQHNFIMQANLLFGDLNIVRSKYMEHMNNGLPIERVEECACSEFAKEWLKAVESNQIRPEDKMNSEEYQWIAGKISEISTKENSVDMDNIYMYYIGCGHDALEVSTYEDNLGADIAYYDAINKILNIGGKGFSENLNFPENSKLKMLDDKISKGEILSNDDFTQGESDLTKSFIESFGYSEEQNVTKTEKEYEPQYADEPVYSSEKQSRDIYDFFEGETIGQRIEQARKQVSEDLEQRIKQMQNNNSSSATEENSQTNTTVDYNVLRVFKNYSR